MNRTVSGCAIISSWLIDSRRHPIRQKWSIERNSGKRFGAHPV
jgi:hypothetical protein